jgi:hypothetical protein
MSEQTYMNLKDAVKRPVLSEKTVNRSNKAFVRMVDNYQKWNESITADEPRETYEDDIFNCLFEYDLDGYNLAEYLKSKVNLAFCDAELVDILDDMIYVKKSLEDEMLKQWVKENFLTISDDVVGKKVNVKQGSRKYENLYITGIRPDTYQVTISDNINAKGGRIVGFENVTFVD